MSARLAFLAALVILLAALPGSAAAAGLRSGCDTARPAVGYRIGETPLTHQPAGAPSPCLEVVSGRAGESANVAVLPSGRILYAPLVDNDNPAPTDDGGPAVVTASDDGGRSWQALESGNSASPNRSLDVPPWMDADPQTHRIWFATALPDLCGGDISWSDDGGKSWQANPLVGCPAMGSERVIEGPAPAGGAEPSGYPHVVYYCANFNDLSQSDLYCYRSLDGGPSFSFVGSFPDGPDQTNCSTEHPARPGAVGTDGDLYFPVFYCGDLSMAISRDEGASWQLVHVADSNVQDLYTTSAAVDSAGNIYLAWIAGPGTASTDHDGIMGSGTPMLSISRDHGASWSTPVAVGPPGVNDAQLIALTARGPGEIAISYLANTNGSTLLDGWLSETGDALAPHALWWAASLNDPSTPLISTTDPTTFGDRLFFTTDTYAPDGEPWAAFHCAKTVACPSERIGVVGRLAPPGASSRSGSLSCAKPSGRLRGATLGPIALGMARSAAQRRLPRFRQIGYGFEDFCLYRGRGIRVAFPSARLLRSVSRSERRRLAGRIVIALTANRYYGLDGVKPGVRVATVARRLRLGKAFHIGLNHWYIAPGEAADGVLKVRHGRVEEIGIASRSLTHTHAAQARFLASFSHG